jgi:hypothetical protein
MPDELKKSLISGAYPSIFNFTECPGKAFVKPFPLLIFVPGTMAFSNFPPGKRRQAVSLFL